MQQNIYHVVGGIILMTTSFFCAGQVVPSGGPPDKTPPEIIETYPEARSTLFNDGKISIQFSKYVDRRSVEESIFISPAIGVLTFNWGGTDVEIHFSDTLRHATTYVMTFGTDVVDMRGRNRMAKAFALPFSTGERIDTGAISGKIFDPKPEGVMVFAYQLDSRNPDTLDPSHVKPDYLTQTGKDGSFLLPYLSLGSYRLIAVRDEFKNLIYEPQTDQYGVWTSDITITDSLPTLSGIQFKMTSEDTSQPFLSSARALDRSHVFLRFSEKMDTSINAGEGVSIVDTLTNVALPILDFSFTDAAATEAQVVTAQQESTKTYRIVLAGFRDAYQNPIQLRASTGFFTGSSIPDTMKPVIQSSNVGDNMKDFQIDDTLQLIFGKPIRRASLERALELEDSTEKRVDGKFYWNGSSRVSFVPNRELLWNCKYTLKIVLDSVKDLSGNHLTDSVWVKHFKTMDERLLGSIKGIVMDERKDARGKLYLTAAEISNKSSKERLIVLESPGPFVLDRLLEGNYTISAFRDADSNKVYTYGSVFPFRPSERFSMLTDTLKIRARWPLEGVTVRLK